MGSRSLSVDKSKDVEAIVAAYHAERCKSLGYSVKVRLSKKSSVEDYSGIDYELHVEDAGSKRIADVKFDVKCCFKDYVWFVVEHSKLSRNKHPILTDRYFYVFKNVAFSISRKEALGYVKKNGLGVHVSSLSKDVVVDGGLTWNVLKGLSKTVVYDDFHAWCKAKGHVLPRDLGTLKMS